MCHLWALALLGWDAVCYNKYAKHGLIPLMQLANSAFGRVVLYDPAVFCFCARRAQKQNTAMK